MREVLRGFRLKIRLMEQEAASEIDKIMAAPTLDMNKLKSMNEAITKAVMKSSMDALKEGNDFGKYIRGKLK